MNIDNLEKYKISNLKQAEKNDASYICKDCFSDKVQQQSWTYINTDTLSDYIEDSIYFCEGCSKDEIQVLCLQNDLDKITTYICSAYFDRLEEK